MTRAPRSIRWLAVLGALFLATPGEAAVRLLVFSKTAAFRHGSIPVALGAIDEIAAARGWQVTATEDATMFRRAVLANHDAVVFLLTSGDVLDDTQQGELQDYIRGGGGFAGIHSASDTEHGWPWYGDLVGAYFVNHPAIQAATALVADPVHPSTASLPMRWARSDEWYNFDRNPRGTAHVLATVDETTYAGGSMGFDHPIAWCQEFDGGRSWYTAMGHSSSTYGEPAFRDHLIGGIEYAAGAVPGDCGATRDVHFHQSVLASDLLQPMELTVAPDGRVLFVERGGAVKIYRPDTGLTGVALQLDVHTEYEDGLLGITVDPDFATNGWVYLYYSPLTSTPSENRVARFTLTGDTIDPTSERVLLGVPTQRQECCHSAGSLAFGPGGNLYIAVGDNTDPFQSGGFTPIDERPGREMQDAQRTAANRDDLRGKILRIHPEPDGTYTIPTGNLFAPDGSEGRPEVYAMGVRNPFRISVDPLSAWLYWGDVGPDSNADNPARGPRGHDELNQARGPGNFGWPYVIADNMPYVDYDFASTLSGSAFDPLALVNDSPNNTGQAALPPALPALLWYSDAASNDFPQLGDGPRTAMAGPLYRYDPANPSTGKLPAYYANTLIFYDWGRSWMRAVKLDEAGDILVINPFLADFDLYRPMDLELGPDGALYLLEWGEGFWTGTGPFTRLSRIAYRPSRGHPIAEVSATPRAGPVPLLVQFSSAGSFDPDGDPLTFEWNLDGVAGIESTDAAPSFLYAQGGEYRAELVVRDPAGNREAASVVILAGNAAPAVVIERPALDGGLFDWGEAIDYRIRVDDLEDGSTRDASLACSAVDVQLWLGHDVHSHPLTHQRDCRGTFITDSDHSDADDVWHILEARYSDRGGPLTGVLTTSHSVTLQPKRKQAEFYSQASGVQLAGSTDGGAGGLVVTSIDHDDWIAFDGLNLHNIQELTLRVASDGPGGWVEVYIDSPDRRQLARLEVPVTGGNDAYVNVTGPIADSNQHFRVDLQSPRTFDRIALDTTGNPNEYPRAYQLYTSDDGIDWRGPVVVGRGTGAITELTFPPRTARHIEVLLTGADPARWSIFELRLFAGAMELDRTGWVATASSSRGPDPPGRALDGDAATRWNLGEAQASGTRRVELRFLRNPGDTDLFRLNWLEFRGRGAASKGPREPSPSGSPTPLYVVKRPAGGIEVLVEDVPDKTGYAVYENAIGTWYGTPARTCHPLWSVRSGRAVLEHAITPGDRWLVVAATDAAGESSCGRDQGGGELNETSAWPESARCP